MFSKSHIREVTINTKKKKITHLRIYNQIIKKPKKITMKYLNFILTSCNIHFFISHYIFRKKDKTDRSAYCNESGNVASCDTGLATKFGTRSLDGATNQSSLGSGMVQCSNRVLCNRKYMAFAYGVDPFRHAFPAFASFR